MRTDPRQLHGQAFDCVVVGAGIQGAAIARDAAARGLRALLVDARDVAAGGTAHSSHLIHGGLGDLRRAQVSLVRESLRERERLLRLAPHLVRPLPMLTPLFEGSAVPAWQLRLGAWLYGRMARRSTLPRPRRLSADEAVAAFPGLRRRGLRGAVELFDARTQAARLTLAIVRDAVAQGAVFCSHARAVACSADGVTLRADGVEVVVRAAVIFNVAGPAVDPLRRALGVDGDDLVRTTRRSHVVLPPRAGELALCAFLPDERVHFLVPHEGGVLCGPADVDDPESGREGAPPRADLDSLHDALGYLLEPAPARAQLRSCDAGWGALPKVAGPPGAPRREAFVVREPIACGRLHTVVGGRLTTHRACAERAVGAAFGIPSASPTRSRPLPGGVGPREVDDPLWWRHGGLAGEVRALGGGDLASPLCEHRPFLACELVYAVQVEGARSFADAMLRRLVDVRGPCLEADCLQRALAVFERAGGQVRDEAATLAAVQDEVRQRAGALDAWQAERP